MSPIILETAVTVFILFVVVKYMLLEGRPLWGVMRCLLRRYHRPYNWQYLGVFRCQDCRLTGRHLGEFGEGGGYVSHLKSGPDKDGHFTREQR